MEHLLSIGGEQYAKILMTFWTHIGNFLVTFIVYWVQLLAHMDIIRGDISKHLPTDNLEPTISHCV